MTSTAIQEATGPHPSIASLIDLTGRVVLVTGGAGGVGRAACLQFAGLGARVVVVDRSCDQLEQTADGAKVLATSALQVEADLADGAAVESVVARTIDELGRLDVLFNNAAVGPSAPPPYTMTGLLESTPENWSAILTTNLTSVGLVSRAALPHLVEAGRGAIVNNASINALVAVPGADAYTSSKGGIVALTRAMAGEWGPRGVRVNALCPGPIDTAMNRPYLDDPTRLTAMTARCPLGRVAIPSEVAAVAVFLASDAASYVNGAIVPVDGGWTAV